MQHIVLSPLFGYSEEEAILTCKLNPNLPIVLRDVEPEVMYETVIYNPMPAIVFPGFRPHKTLYRGTDKNEAERKVQSVKDGTKAQLLTHFMLPTNRFKVLFDDGQIVIKKGNNMSDSAFVFLQHNRDTHEQLQLLHDGSAQILRRFEDPLNATIVVVAIMHRHETIRFNTVGPLGMITTYIWTGDEMDISYTRNFEQISS